MSEDIIGMGDMDAIFDITDELGIDREQISVPLEKEGHGAVRKLATAELEIVVPLNVSTEDWLAFLRSSLEEMGFSPVEED